MCKSCLLKNLLIVFFFPLLSRENEFFSVANPINSLSLSLTPSLPLLPWLATAVLIEETSSPVKPWPVTAETTRLECAIFHTKTSFTMTTRTSGYEDRHTTNTFLWFRSKQIPQTSSHPPHIVMTNVMITASNYRGKIRICAHISVISSFYQSVTPINSVFNNL